MNEGQTIYEAERKPWIAVLGFAPSKKHFAWADGRWWNWGCNDLYAHVPRVDVTFEIHHTMNMGARRNPEHEAALRGGGKRGTGFAIGNPATPVFMQEAHPEYPTVMAFPKNQIIEAFGKLNLSPLEYTPSVAAGADYFTNSISWMLALAILELTEERKINGVLRRVAKPDSRLAVCGVSMAADCVAPETRVLTEDLRWIPASEVKVGDRLMSFDEHPQNKGIGNKYRRWRVGTVEQASEVMKPCYRLSLEDGTKMTVSENHGWLVDLLNDHSWKTTSQLRDKASANKARFASRLTKVIEPWDELHSRDAGYLAAAFDGEGHLSQQQLSHCDTHCMRVSYAQRENAMSREVEAALQKYGFDYTIQTPKGSDCRSFNLLGGRPELLRFLGQVRPSRLLEKLDTSILGRFQKKEHVAVEEKTFVGEQPVIALKLDTGTFIAEGFASHNSEYAVQKPSVEYWIGRAQGYGIEVWVPDDAHILKSATLYGYASSSPLRIRLQSDREDLRGKKVETQQQLQQAQQAVQQAEANLIAQRAIADYIDGLERNLVIGTEIGIGEKAREYDPTITDPNQLGSGRNTILELKDGQTVETVIIPSDNQASVPVGGQ